MRFKAHIVLMLSLLFYGCGVSKFIPQDKTLIEEENIEFVNPDKITNQKKISTILKGKNPLKPKYGIGNIGLWLYYKTETTKVRGLKKWINKKFGKAPIYYNQSTIERNRLVIENAMQEQGYFGADVRLDTAFFGNSISLNFEITSKGQFAINEVIYPRDTTFYSPLFKPKKNKPPLSPGAYYKKDNLDKERDRLYLEMGESGFLEFEKNDIIFYLDTTVVPLKTDIYVNVRNRNMTNASRQYHIGDTYVYPDYNLEIDSMKLLNRDTIQLPKLNIIQSSQTFKPRLLSRIIIQEPGVIAKSQTQYLAIRKFQNLGVFKFTNADFSKRVNNDTAYLDRHFYLTPSLTQDIVGNFELNNRTGGFFGTTASLTYAHRNLLKGAERLDVSASVGLETLIGESSSFTNTLDINLSGTLSFPYLVLPFRFGIANASNTQTKVKLSNNFQIRNDFFTLSAFNTSFGYSWRPNSRSSINFTPLQISMVKLLSSTVAFDEILAGTPRLQTSFQSTFILGLEFNYNYTSQTGDAKKPYFLFNGNFSTAGNLISLLDNSSIGTDSGSREVFGVAYAQYIKLVPDLRYYIPFRNSLLASRINLGIGLPYGNSEEMPYLEQFYVGGSNSIRAFRIRELGPGSFFQENQDDPTDFFDQTGDIKLELSVDYRFDIAGFFKGAVFADAANIWLIKSDITSEGRFDIRRFYKEIAIGAGAGLRLDFDFFVIRLDGAIALRKPTVDGFQWTFSDIDIFDRNWRRKNLVWNLALGYPF